jgi:putative transposase
VQPLPETGHEAGVDLGIETFATLSDGTRIFHPGWYRQAERALKTAQRRVSRRKKGSHRRRKAVMLLANRHQKVRRQRAAFHHKTALALVSAHDTIYHEDLQTANMLKNHHLAKSIQDAGAEPVLEHPCFQSSIRWEASRRRSACLHQPAVFGLWACSVERLIGPVASLSL